MGFLDARLSAALPCERVFSSSKETDTLRRSALSPLMEILQILKFIHRSDRLSFTDGLLSSEIEQSILDIDLDVIDKPTAEGKIEELYKVISEAWAGWGRDSDMQNVADAGLVDENSGDEGDEDLGPDSEGSNSSS